MGIESSKNHAFACLQALSGAVAEIDRALAMVHEAKAHPRIYIAELEKATRRIAEAQEECLGARVEARRFVDLKED